MTKRDRRLDRARAQIAAEAATALADAQTLADRQSRLLRGSGKPAEVSDVSQEPVKSAWNAHLRERFEIGGFGGSRHEAG